jgi:hypothetical protein
MSKTAADRINGTFSELLKYYTSGMCGTNFIEIKANLHKEEHMNLQPS